MNVDKSQRGEQLNLKGELLEEVDVFKYLEAILGKNGGVMEDVLKKVNEGAKVAGAMSRGWRGRSLGINVKGMMDEIIVLCCIGQKREV